VTADLRRVVDAVTTHTHSCRHDRTDLIDALTATVDHATTCLQIDRDLLIELAGRAERLRLHLIDSYYPHPADAAERKRHGHN
jgi:hypothetical protein